MRNAIAYSLVGLLALSACQFNPGTRATTRTTRVAKADPSPTVAGAKAAKGSPAMEGPMATLKGELRVDAHYVVAAGGGNVVAAGGGNVVAVGGGNVVAVGGGNVIAVGGGNLLGPAGGNLLGPAGANFRLAATSAVPVGTILPAKGMAVVPVSLLTGEPIGEVAFTGDRGDYRVSVPERLKGDVLLFASTPGASRDDAVLNDARLHYGVLPVVSGGADSALIDEDTARVSGYLRTAFRDTLEGMMEVASPDYKPGAVFGTWLKGSSGGLVEPIVMELVRAMVAAKTPSMTPAARRALADRLSGAVAAETDWTSAMVDKTIPGWAPEEDETAMAAMLDLMRQGREKAAEKMVAEPGFFDEAVWLLDANRFSDGGEPFAIRKPSDLNDFLVRAYIGPNEPGSTEKVRVVYAAIGVPEAQADRLRAVQYGILGQIGLTLVLKPTLKTRLAELVREAGEK